MLNTSKVSKQNRPWFSFIKITNSKFDEFYSSHYRYKNALLFISIKYLIEMFPFFVLLLLLPLSPSPLPLTLFPLPPSPTPSPYP